jgi:hypothetical protein
MSFSNLLLWFQFQNDVLTCAIDEKKNTQKTSELDYLVEIQITYLLLDASIVERTFAFNQDSSDICFLASYCDIMKKDDNAR